MDIFFVISGFIMYFVHHQDFAKPGMSGRFFLRRLIRIVPTYWLLTTMTVAGLVLLPAGVEFALIFVAAVIVGHLFFVLVERPVYRLLKARFLTRKTTEVPA